MEKERKIRILSIGALLVAIIGLTVAFAAMSRTLIINGTATVDSAKWDIHFANPLLKSKKGDAREVSAPVISEDGGDLTLKVGLRKPQDEIVYNVDVVNVGDIDAEITKIDYPELSEEHAKIIEFEAVYDDGSSIALAQELKAGDSKKVKITIRFKDITDESLLASEAYNIPLTFKIHYTQSGAGSNSGDGGFTPEGGEEILPDLETPDFTLDSKGTIIGYNRDLVTINSEGYLVVPAVNSEGKPIKAIDNASFDSFSAVEFYDYNEETDEEKSGFIIYDEANYDEIEQYIIDENSGSGSGSGSGSASDIPDIYSVSEIDELNLSSNVEYEYYKYIYEYDDKEDEYYYNFTSEWEVTLEFEKIDLTEATNLELIDTCAFLDSNIKSIKLGNSIKTINWGAFEASTLAGELVIPSSVTSIKGAVFNSTNLTKIIVKRADSTGMDLEDGWNGSIGVIYDPNY